MKQLITIPHRTAHGLCIVNGIRDLIEWRIGRDWSNEFVYGLGQGSGFAYIKIKNASPPRQVYWGIATPRQHEYLAGLLGAEHTIVENRTFKFAWKKASEAINAGTPPILGPLDMYYLPYYKHIYHQRHIPIHYVLLVGYDSQYAYFHDTDNVGVQIIPIDELELAWNVNVPAMGKKNRLVTFNIPNESVPKEALILRSIKNKCQSILYPPVNMLGVPGIKKLAKEIRDWPEELGEPATTACLRQVCEYLNTPPDMAGDHLTATRDLYIAFLKEAGAMICLDFTKPIVLLNQSMENIPVLAHAIRRSALDEAGIQLEQIAEMERSAYTELSKIIA